MNTLLETQIHLEMGTLLSIAIALLAGLLMTRIFKPVKLPAVTAYLIAGVLMISNPQIHTNLFVRLYHADIEEGLRINAGVPADDVVLFGYKYVNTWEGEHSMVEFLITTRGDTYYGCYYSPDDVPLAFQNTAAELTQCGHDSWKWSAEGDNAGKTMKIMDHWYYFEASF